LLLDECVDRRLARDIDGHEVCVSGNWRITFGFVRGDAVNVDYEDYH
jgi:plasmid maintenance system killer protein